MAVHQIRKASKKTNIPEVSVSDAAVSGDLESLRQHIAAGRSKCSKSSKWSHSLDCSRIWPKEAVSLLIDAGADLELKNNEGSTALITAAFVCREEIVKSLLKSGLILVHEIKLV